MRYFLALAALLYTAPAFADGQITVTGEATAKVAPDQVTLPVTVRTENALLKAAKLENDKKVKALLALAEKHGIRKEKMQTTYTSVNPVYDYVQNSKPKLRGYDAQTSINFTLTDMGDVGAFINDVVDAGIDQQGGLSYSLQDEKSLKEETLMGALKNAKQKAEKLAATAGLNLGAPINIVEGEVAMNMPQPRPMMAMKAAFASAPMAPAPDLPAGLIEVRQTVTVTYDTK